MRAFIIAYAVIGFVTAIWWDAMDRHYSAPGAASGFVVTCMAGALWPVALPAAMTIIVYPNGARWAIERSDVK